jgi:acetolactate synthase I/II/III large subunit
LKGKKLMKASDYIAKFLEYQKVTHVFELSGGMITHILDSLNALGSINIITMHHEQGASFAADGFARVSGLPGIALATSGPGATNLLTGIGSCYFDSVPAVFITGQVNVHEQKGDKPIRQLGFQETDIVSMAGPITKAVYKIDDVKQLPSVLHEAFRIAMGDRPGPVLIDIPMNIQRESVEAEIERVKPIYDKATKPGDAFWEDLYSVLKSSKKPLMLAGRGVMSAFSRKEFISLAELTGIPIITSLMAVDAIPYTHPLRVGFIGSYGNRWANLAIGECDSMIVIGSRLDIRQTGADTKGFKGDKIIYHIDIEEGEMNNRVPGCIPVHTDVRSFLLTALNYFEKKEFPSYKEWKQQIQSLKISWPDTKEITAIKGINPNSFMHSVSKVSKQASAYIADVGSHQMWAAQSLEILGHQYFLTSGGMGAMGYALPAAIGACFASNNSPVVVVSGDGGFQLNIQELQTIVRNKLPIKIIVINNLSLGMIRQFQDSYFNSKYQSTMWGYDTPNFQKVAEAYGIEAATIEEDKDIEAGLSRLWQNLDKPFLLQVMIDPFANAYPKIAFGKPITEMEPFAKPIDMEGT